MPHTTKWPLVPLLLMLLAACATPAPPPAATPTAPASPLALQLPSPTPGATSAPAPTTAPPPTRIASTAGPAPVISNVSAVVQQVAPFEKFELHFDLQTSARYPDLPYDAAPPAGLAPGSGVSVDALFSRDNWTTVITQPAFLAQPYRLAVQDGKDHLVPAGLPRWTVRFTPQQAGSWQYRLRARDAGGETLHPPQGALAFSVAGAATNPYLQRGFIRVSPTDRRYFAFQAGGPFVGVGFNTAFGSAGDAERKLTSFEQNQINFVRLWLSAAGINGSHWTSWASHHLSPNGYLPGVELDSRVADSGTELSWRLDDANPCMFAGFWQGGIPVEPGQRYQLAARVKLDAVSGPDAATAGFTIKRGEWLDRACDQPGQGTALPLATGTASPTTVLAGTSEWITVTSTFTAEAGQHWLGYLYLARQNAGGRAYVSAVRLWRADDPAQTDLLHEPWADSHLHFDGMNAARWDAYLAAAEQHGVYIKLVIDEKNEWIRNHLAADGNLASEGNNNNFYGTAASKSRWLQAAWWRYLIARWGYSTAIHSFEYINEGDPYNQQHYDAAHAFASYVKQNDPARHLVTTSFWAGVPNREFWSNPAYSAIDYADLHAYYSSGWGQDASFLEAGRRETNPAHVFSGDGAARLAANDNNNQAITPRGLVIRGPGEWLIRYRMKAENFSADCPFGTTGGMQRVRWQLDGGNFEKPQGSGPWEGVVPPNREAKDFVCTSPGGSFDWTEFRSDRDRDGQPVIDQARLVLPDDTPRELSLRIENSAATAGTAWIDQVELVAPDGRVVPVIGQFDTTSLADDSAWSNAAYGLLHGATSPVGVQMPLVRGETGIDNLTPLEFNPGLLKDTSAVWLHNLVWAQLGPGGMYDLPWWSTETISETHYPIYAAYQTFMRDIPLDNGQYHDAAAQCSEPLLRAWGQRDDTNRRAHLWVSHREYTWARAVAGPAITPVGGTISLAGWPAGNYNVTWWDTRAVGGPALKTETVASNGTLTLSLPNALNSDIAVKIAPAG